MVFFFHGAPGRGVRPFQGQLPRKAIPIAHQGLEDGAAEAKVFRGRGEGALGTGFLELEGDPIGSAFRLQGDLVGAHCLGEVQFLQNGQAGRGAAQIGGFQGIEVFRPSLSQIGRTGRSEKRATGGPGGGIPGGPPSFCEAE